MATARGFWSYVHSDDEAEGGRISQLARDVVAQYQMITGDMIELFLDRDSLEWGDDWRPKVDSSLASVAFFIPVLTPRYFQSAECRRELNFFGRRATSLGVRELVMPIMYVDAPGLHDDPPVDEAMALVKPFQWEDWTQLRFASPQSGEYRIAVSRLAKRLAEANDAADRADVSGRAIALGEELDEDQVPGVLDRMAEAEEVMPQWSETIASIGREIETIGGLMQSATDDVTRGETQGKGFAARLTVLRRVARDLKEPTKRIQTFGQLFTSQLNSVDSGMRIIIERAPAEVEEEPGAKDAACAFFKSLRELAASAEEGLGALQGMVDAITPLEGMSRDLRPSLRNLRLGLTMMLEGRVVTNEWLELIDNSPLRCEEELTPELL